MIVRRALAAAAAVALAVLPGAAAADSRVSAPRQAVALLPLDADARLEIYGQPVATEIARALISGGIDVVVVGAKMDVPADARLIVDGTIATDKGGVTLSMRIRNPLDGTVLDTLSATAPGLAQIDKAAADLSARVVPVVREQLAALAARSRHRAGAPAAAGPADGGRAAEADARRDRVARGGRAAARRARPTPPSPGRARPPASRGRSTRAASVPGSRRRRSRPPTPSAPSRSRSSATRPTSKRDVPLARARVRVRISDASAVLFDRVVSPTRSSASAGCLAEALAARVARGGARDPAAARAQGGVAVAVSAPWPRDRRLAAVLALALAARLAAAQAPSDALRDGNTAATAGDWARVSALVDPLLRGAAARPPISPRRTGSPASRRSSPAQRDVAEAHFLAYLRIDLDGHLDPALYPPDVVGFFNDVRATHQRRAARAAPQGAALLAAEPDPAGRPVPERRAHEGVRGRRPARRARDRQRHDLPRAALVVHARWPAPAARASTCDDGRRPRRGASTLRAINIATGIGLIVTYVYGVYDGVRGYRRRESIQPFVAPVAGGGLLGVGGAF